MSAEVASLLPARWNGAHLPALTPARQERRDGGAVTAGPGRVPPGPA